MKKKRIYLNAFDMNCVAHQSPGLWRHPDDQAGRYKDIEYWVELAKTLEKGRFDGLFIADVIGIYDVYGNDKETTIREATQVPVNDPILLVSAMSHATKHLGFGITCSTTFEHPYPFARRISTSVIKKQVYLQTLQKFMRFSIKGNILMFPVSIYVSHPHNEHQYYSKRVPQRLVKSLQQSMQNVHLFLYHQRRQVWHM